MRWPWLCALLLGSEDPGRVNPDRPNLTNSTTLVAPGAVQIEAGIDAQVHGRAENDPFRVAMPLLIRIGLHERAELRLIEGDPWRWALVTASFGRDFLDRRLQLWVESYARIALVQGELSEVAGDLGLIVTVHRRVALDVAGLVGQVGGDTLVAAVLAGISVRIGPP